MSVFSEIPPSHWVASNRSGFAIGDAFPVTVGHTLVIPRREIVTWWEASPDERARSDELVDHVKELLDVQYGPDRYNVGFNAGPAAGQTVGHLHIHVIPGASATWPIPEVGSVTSSRPRETISATAKGAQRRRIRVRLACRSGRSPR